MPSGASATQSMVDQQEFRTKAILSAQIQLLYANGKVGVGVTILAATILALLQWQVVPHPVVLAWWLYMILVSLYRRALYVRYRRASSGGAELRRWRAAFTAGAGLAGAGWGAAGILLYPEGHLTNQVFLVFVLGGMMLGAASLLAPRPEAFLAFLLPTGLGPSIRLLVQGDATHLAMGLLAAVFTLATVITTRRIHQTITSSLSLQFENQHLLDDLRAAKNQTEALNQELEIKVQARTAELIHSTEKLRAEITQRAQVERELLRANEALLNSEKLAVTARLAATMAHEINNPLAAITNLTFLLSPLQTSSEARSYVSMLEEQVKGLSRITTQMLKFHRDNNQPTKYRLDIALGEVLDFYRPLAEKQGVTLKQRIETDAAIVGFRGEIIQVITNLLLNALEATPTGGTVSVHLYPAPRWLLELRDSYGYCLTIADTGRGIDPQHRKRIFEPFFTTKGDKGTGLGLWVCGGIINRIGGSIRVWTRWTGRTGTCFRLFLPAVEATWQQRTNQPKQLSSADSAC